MSGSLTGLDTGYIDDGRVPAPSFTSHSCVDSRPWLVSVASLSARFRVAGRVTALWTRARTEVQAERVFPSGNLWNLDDSIRVSFHAAES